LRRFHEVVATNISTPEAYAFGRGGIHNLNNSTAHLSDNFIANNTLGNRWGGITILDNIEEHTNNMHLPPSYSLYNITPTNNAIRETPLVVRGNGGGRVRNAHKNLLKMHKRRKERRLEKQRPVDEQTAKTPQDTQSPPPLQNAPPLQTPPSS